jgi:hypothetical protein
LPRHSQTFAKSIEGAKIAADEDAGACDLARSVRVSAVMTIKRSPDSIWFGLDHAEQHTCRAFRPARALFPLSQRRKGDTETLREDMLSHAKLETRSAHVYSLFGPFDSGAGKDACTRLAAFARLSVGPV